MIQGKFGVFVMYINALTNKVILQLYLWQCYNLILKIKHKLHTASAPSPGEKFWVGMCVLFGRRVPRLLRFLVLLLTMVFALETWQWFGLRKTDRLLCDQSPTLFRSTALSGVRDSAVLIMLTAVSSEFLVSTNQTTRRHDPENYNFHTLQP